MMIGALGLLAVLVLLPIAVTLFACRSFIYHPTRMAPSDAGWTIDQVEVEDSVRVVGRVRRPLAADAPWILFFGGNASPLAGNQEVLAATSTSAGLAAYAYRGYDGSEGSPSERALIADAGVLARHLREKHGVEPSRLIVAGQSLGSGIAAQLAAQLSRAGTPPRALVLLSPYTSMAEVFDLHVPVIPVGWAVSDPYRTTNVIRDVACPILIIHGSEDRLIPIAQGRRLAELAGSRARLVELEGREHNDLWDDPRTLRAIAELL